MLHQISRTLLESENFVRAKIISQFSTLQSVRRLLHNTHLRREAPRKPRRIREVVCETLKHIMHGMLIHKL